MNKLTKIFSYLKGYWKYGVLNIVFNMLSVVFSLFSLTMLAPFLNLLFLKNDNEYHEQLAKGVPEVKMSVQSLIDNFNYYLTNMVVTQGKMQALILICIIVVTVIFLKNIFRYAALYYISPIRNGVVKDLRNAIYSKVLRLPLSYYNEEKKGDILSRMTNDVMDIEWSVMQSLEMFFRDPLNIIAFLGTLIFLSPQLTLLVLILLPVTGLIIGKVGKSLKRTSFKGKESMGVLLSLMEETLSGLRIITAFNGQEKAEEKFYAENERYNVLSIRAYRKADLASPISEFLGVAVLVIIMYFGGQLVLGEKASLTGAVFITYIAIFSQLIPPVKSVTVAYYNIMKGLASGERINKILQADLSIIENPNPSPLDGFKDKIEYKNVTFSYSNGVEVLSGINLEIKKGKTIALVGQSGAGKSTLADLLPRFYDCTAGAILIDGLPIKDIGLKNLRQQMGIVTQESILFNDTVFGNIAFGMENATEEAVIRAAKVANAHDFIMQMEQGYQTNIGDRGGKLSGGQRQRLSIARAVLKNPPILILDEATSALDIESERLVQDALNKLLENRTSLVIAHRLSTIQHADEIIVMHQGKIAERGKHAELHAANGVYRKLCDMQSFS